MTPTDRVPPYSRVTRRPRRKAPGVVRCEVHSCPTSLKSPTNMYRANYMLPCPQLTRFDTDVNTCYRTVAELSRLHMLKRCHRDIL